MLKCLADGRIYAADGEQNRRDDLCYLVRKVVRIDSNGRIDYHIDSDGEVVRVVSNGVVLTEKPIVEFIGENESLFQGILNSKGRAFSLPDTDAFLRSIGVESLKSPSSEKIDITLEIFEPQINSNVEQGFSIKSKLKAPATLINASRQTNFEFRLPGLADGLASEVDSILSGGGRNRYTDAFNLLRENNIPLIFDGMCSETYEDNLMMVFPNAPKIAAEMVRIWFCDRISDMDQIAERMNTTNPVGLRDPASRPFYKNMIQEILVKHALGLKPGSPWSGEEDANGGYIIVKMNGDILCYHIYERNDFKEYLFRNTHMDTAKQDRNDFGRLYKKGGNWFVKLNLQVRFC